MDSDFTVTIIGSNSAIAAFGRYPTAQFVKFKNHHFLIDCGEGTQFRLTDYSLPKSHINKIFISHLHGDHFFGLVGLLTSYSLAGRTKPLEIYAPKGLQEIIEIQTKFSDAYFTYEINYIITNNEQVNVIYEDAFIKISSIPLIHRIATTGFKFEEKNLELKIIKEKINEFQLSVDEIIQLKNKQNVTRSDGIIFNFVDFTYAEKKPRIYAYCSDTIFNEAIINSIENVDLLYHETTFEKKLVDLAAKTLHSTTEQAAIIAKKANVKALLIGHFSSRYQQVDFLLQECREIFINTAIAVEGKSYIIE